MPLDADVAHGRRAFRLTATAFLWSVGLVVAALIVPVYSGTDTRSGTGIPTVATHSNSTLVGENGLGILVVLGVPTIVTVLVWLALHDKCSRGRQSSGYVAWGLIGLLAAFSLLGVLSIGIFVLPVARCSPRRRGSRRRQPSIWLAGHDRGVPPRIRPPKRRDNAFWRSSRDAGAAWCSSSAPEVSPRVSRSRLS
jgi:hypothetical protein